MNVELPASPAADDPQVLVVVMNNLRDWDLAQSDGWYRIPVNRAPRQIGAEYLAFYFTKPFGELAWAVHYMAPVREVHLAQRSDLLPDEADHPRAKDLYYRVVIGPVEPLPRPIPSQRLRRLTFLPTTLSRLLAAEEINDLWVREPAEEKLWRALRDAGVEAEGALEIKEGETEYRIDIAIPCRDGGISVGAAAASPVPMGWLYVCAPVAEGDDWAALIDNIEQLAASLGGIERSMGS